ncbi:MAG: signal peptidase II [bacterium]|nr:signal peptidase II [bacterium]
MSLIISALIVILADQVLKYAAFEFLDGPKVVLGFLRLSQVTNRGVAFGIGSDIESAPWGRYFFLLLSLVIVIALLTLFARYCRTRLWARISLGLIVGGAISNLADRLMFGYVRDFIDLRFWPTFNGADLAICAGVVLLIAGMLKEESGRKAPVSPPPPNPKL